ncbi:ribose transport system substrate-binding protein [Rhizobium sp. SLBN-94]|nr:ribose transport system substrate-binding protein [Rhizobium sp. SLBN-94]
MRNDFYKKIGVLSAACAVGVLASSGAFGGPVRVDQGADIRPLCGTNPIKIALIDGYGGDTWRKITLAELKDEASKCQNISDIQYTDAGGDAQAYNAAINSYSAQGFDIIFAFTDFGDAATPAYRSAFQAGVTMVPYFGVLKGRPGVDFAVNPYQDSVAIGKTFAEWVGKALDGKGYVLMLGGPAGASSSADFMKGYKEGLKQFPGLKLLDQNYITTNWNPADAQKAAAGLIAKYPQIDAIASDYGVTALATIKAFEQAGLKVPAMAAIATNNEMNCKYVRGLESGKAWPYLALDGSNGDIRFALRHALAYHNKLDNKEPLGVVPYVFADSTANVKPKCSETAPPDADMSSLLPPEKLEALFK